MTVQQLIDALEYASRDDEVRIAYDSGCAYTKARSVDVEVGYVYICDTVSGGREDGAHRDPKTVPVLP